MSNINSQLPWSKSNKKKKEHPWHTMCSYLGSFPASLAGTFIEVLSDPKDIVLDPFCGRGTTLLECRLSGRIPLASDLNPIAVALTKAKNISLNLVTAMDRITELENSYDLPLYLPEALDQPEDIKLIYNPFTLAQLCFLRRKLREPKSDVDTFLIGVILGLMHGKERKDGTSAYASISMPNTFSMSPNYVRRFVQNNNLQRVERNVFTLMKDKIHRLYSNYSDFESIGIVTCLDIKTISTSNEFSPFKGKVKLVITSPPYSNVVNYALQNWIRMWFLFKDAREVADILDDNLTFGASLEFLEQAVKEIQLMLDDDGVAVIIIGDIARSKNNIVSPARDLIRRVSEKGIFGYIGFMSDYLNTDGKTTRIWNDTKGCATNVDRIILLSNKPPVFRTNNLCSAFDPVNLSRNAIQFARLGGADENLDL
jgi:site-specific DNA-methyltransferase (adenine-specific)